jgi:DNA polymerase-3 subunit gamma/tau
MSYLVLARKWRPKTFADTVGQEHVLQALINALESGRLHHAYLFAGTRGVGKTTIARILAKALNCESGISAEPCGECSACREIDEGRFVDLIEVDAASKTKVDDTRELLDNVQYSPARGRFKVYLIDEVHMLSKHSFNALLKTLEEPPPHVKFLLATTEPQKLPVTVLSRCLQFNLSRLTPRLISDRLAYICSEEGIDADAGALNMLARAADGSVRDALSLLDQAIAYCGGRVEETPVAAMLGTINRDHVMKLLRLLADNDGQGVINIISEIDSQFPDYGRLLDDLARLLQRASIFQVLGSTEHDDEFDVEELQQVANEISAADLQLFYQTALMGRRDLDLAPDPRSGAEMTLLRMLTFRPAASVQSTVPGGGVKKPAAKSSPANVAAESESSAAAQPAAHAAAHATATADVDWSKIDWAQMIGKLDLKGAVRLLAINCAFLRRDAATLFFSLDAKSESMLTRQRRDALAEALSTHFGESLSIDIEIGEAAPETPVQEESRMVGERFEAAKAALESDPNVQTMQKMFGAELKADSIEPITPSQSD